TTASPSRLGNIPRPSRWFRSLVPGLIFGSSAGLRRRLEDGEGCAKGVGEPSDPANLRYVRGGHEDGTAVLLHPGNNFICVGYREVRHPARFRVLLGLDKAAERGILLVAISGGEHAVDHAGHLRLLRPPA